jgi:hypothetical protein
LFPARRGDSDAGDRSADGDRSEDSGQPWTATAYSLVLLRDLGVDPRCDQVRRAVTLVRDNCRWEHAGQPFFSGEVEPCINGMVIALGTYFDQDVDGVVARLVGEQLEDGGWNCWVEYGLVALRSRPGSGCWKGCWRTSAQPVARRSPSRLDAGVRSTSSNESCSGGRAPARWPTRPGCNSRFRLVALRRAPCPGVLPCRRGSPRPAGGRSHPVAPIQTAARRHLAGGTRYGLCVPSAGTGSRPAERPRRDARPRRRWRGRKAAGW